MEPETEKFTKAAPVLQLPRYGSDAAIRHSVHKNLCNAALIFFIVGNYQILPYKNRIIDMVALFYFFNI